MGEKEVKFSTLLVIHSLIYQWYLWLSDPVDPLFAGFRSHSYLFSFDNQRYNIQKRQGGRWEEGQKRIFEYFNVTCIQEPRYPYLATILNSYPTLVCRFYSLWWKSPKTSLISFVVRISSHSPRSPTRRLYYCQSRFSPESIISHTYFLFILLD